MFQWAKQAFIGTVVRCLNHRFLLNVIVSHFKIEKLLFVVVDPRWQVHDVPQSVYVCPCAGLPATDRMGGISITQVPGRTIPVTRVTDMCWCCWIRMNMRSYFISVITSIIEVFSLWGT